MYGLADCNNFFVSCERLFRPDLNGKAVVVLSNNDGCAISRSNEAKALGIKMGQPMYQFRDLVRSGQVTVFSSNFMLYGDISHRIHATLAEAAPAIEIYSIDEAFLDLRGIPEEDLDDLGHRMHRLCMRNVGIPVSIGISRTKTLAKIASKLCKQYPALKGACVMKRPCDIEKVLRKFPVGDVWGIGRRLSARLALRGVSTAYDYFCLPREWVAANLGLPALRTWTELHGTPCISFGTEQASRQQICVSRSFAKEITDSEELFGQLALFTSMAAEKLRRQGSLAGEMTVFMRSDRFREDRPQHLLNRLCILDPATDDTSEMLAAARTAFRGMYREGIPIKKAGVVLGGIIPSGGRQLDLFDGKDREKGSRLMSVMDSINSREGRGSIAFASQDAAGIRMNRGHLSPQYTTKWEDIMTVKA